MKRIFLGLVFAALAYCTAGAQTATNIQARGVATCGVQTLTVGVYYPVTQDLTGTLCSAGGGGGGSAAPFAPNGNYGTLTATAATSASTAMPAGATVAFQNTSTVDVSCVLSSGAAVATTNKLVVRGGSTVFVAVGANTNAACINQTGVASNVIVMAGGTGLGTNFGGGGSGGGGGAITAALGSYATGALSAGAFAAGAGVDGWDLTQGARADAAWTSGSGSVIALLKAIATAEIVANRAVNVAQINGVTPLMGLGASGTGSQRVTAASDSPEVAGIGGTADAAATVGSIGSLNAKLRLMTSQLDAIATAIGQPIPAGSNVIGGVNVSSYAASTWSPGTSNDGLFAAVLSLQTTEMNALANAAVAVSTVGGTSGTFTNSNTAQARIGEVYFTSGATATCTAGGNLTGWFLQSYDGTTFESTTVAPPRSPDFIIPFPTAAIGTGTFKGQTQVSIPALKFKVLVQNNCGAALGATANVVRLAPLAGLN